MIYICYGVTKSASTYLYQLTEEILSLSGLGFCRIRHSGPLGTANYYDAVTPGLIDRVASAACGRPVVLKTHGDLHPEVARRIEAGAVLASASIRDPREIALSMADHGVRARARGEDAFSEVGDPLDTLASIDAQIAVFERWAAVENTEVFTYNQICFDTGATIARLAAQIGVDVDVAQVLAPFAQPGAIGQFNMGRPQRYREMDAATQAQFLTRYAGFYARMDVAMGLPQPGDPAPPQRRPAAGPLSRKAADTRRLLRRLARSRDIGTIHAG